MNGKQALRAVGLAAAFSLVPISFAFGQESPRTVGSPSAGSFDGIGAVADADKSSLPLTADMEAFLAGKGDCKESRILDRLAALRQSFDQAAGHADRVTRWMEARERELRQQGLSILEELVILRSLRDSVQGDHLALAGASLEDFRRDLDQVRADRSQLIAQTIAEARRIKQMIASIKGSNLEQGFSAQVVDE